MYKNSLFAIRPCLTFCASQVRFAKTKVAPPKVATKVVPKAAPPKSAPTKVAPKAQPSEKVKKLQQVEVETKKKLDAKQQSMKEKQESRLKRLEEEAEARRLKKIEELEKWKIQEKVKRVKAEEEEKLKRKKEREQLKKTKEAEKEKQKAIKQKLAEKAAKAKDPDAPKRPLNAFSWFFSQRSADVKEDIKRTVDPNTSLSGAVLVKHARAMFEQLSPEDKAKFDALAAKDKERYTKERTAYLKKKNQNKRPLTAFLLYSQEKRTAVSQKLSATYQGRELLVETAKQLGVMWRKLTDAQKKPYIDKAAKAMAEHASKNQKE